MSKTNETYVPLSRGIVEHLKIIKGMPLTVYVYLLAEAKYSGEEKGKLKRKIKDIADEIEIDYKTTHTALEKLKKLKYITIKPAKNQHSLTEFKILKYKTVKDFLKEEQHPKVTQATPQAVTQATPVATEQQQNSTVENSSNYTGLQPPKKLRSKEGKELKKNLKNNSAFSRPDFVDPETWQDFLDVRISCKAKNTVAALSRIVIKLTKLREQGQDANEILNNSIINSWKGVFELKDNQRTTPKEIKLDPDVWGKTQ